MLANHESLCTEKQNTSYSAAVKMCKETRRYLETGSFPQHRYLILKVHVFNNISIY